VGEDLLDDVGIFDTGDDPHCPVAGRAGLDIDAKDLLEALRPGHCGAAYSGIRYRRKKTAEWCGLAVRLWPTAPFSRPGSAKHPDGGNALPGNGRSHHKPAAHWMPPDRPQWVDYGLLRRTI
jgi:hypothetical protein